MSETEQIAKSMLRAAFNAGACSAAKFRDTMPPEDASAAEIDAWLDDVWADSILGGAISIADVIEHSDA